MEKKNETASLLALIGAIVLILRMLAGIIFSFLMGSFTLAGDSDLLWMLITLAGYGFTLLIAITAIFLSIRIRKKVTTQAQGIILIVIGSLTILSQLLPSILFIIAGVMLLIHYKNNVQPK